MEINAGQKVSLATFNGTSDAPVNCDPTENYWALIGVPGVIVQDPEQETIYADFSSAKRVLVQFSTSPSALGLHCHNTIPDALWVLESDLEAVG